MVLVRHKRKISLQENSDLDLLSEGLALVVVVVVVADICLSREIMVAPKNKNKQQR